MLRSFTYHLFYENSIRTELSRNLLTVLLKAEGALAKSISEPYITRMHLQAEEHLTLRTKLCVAIKTVYKREVIRALLKLVMAPTTDQDEAVRVLETFDFLKAEQLKTVTQTPIAANVFPTALTSLGDEWPMYIFPNFDYAAVSQTEYEECCVYLRNAFGKVGHLNGLQINDFAHDKLPAKLRLSVKDPEYYQYIFRILCQKKDFYMSITDEVALDMLFKLEAFESHKLMLDDYTSFIDMAPQVHSHELDSKATRKVASALFNQGILYVHHSQKARFIEICKRFEVVYNDKGDINEHSLNSAWAFSKNHTATNLPFTLPPRKLVIRPSKSAEALSPRQSRKSVNFSISSEDLNAVAPAPTLIGTSAAQLEPADAASKIKDVAQIRRFSGGPFSPRNRNDEIPGMLVPIQSTASQENPAHKSGSSSPPQSPTRGSQDGKGSPTHHSILTPRSRKF